jgi:hypothetical protein
VVVAGAGVLIGFSAVLFFQKSRWAPRLMIGLLALDVVANVLVVVLGGESGRAEARGLASSALRGLIWIPYFLVSKRVKATFVE